MTAAAYTTDLADLTLCEATTGVTEPGTWTAGGLPVNETDYYIQGSNCCSKTFNATSLGGLVYTAGAGVTIPADGAFMAWQYFAAPNALDTDANGGIRLIVGSATTAFKAWNLGGRDSYAYGGWQCLAVDPTLTADYTVGSPTSTLLTFGWAANITNAVAKGNPFGMDALRYGRCELRVNGGDLANGYATFAGIAAANDATSARWGLLQAIEGGYKWQGLMTLGYTSAVDFRDSNKSIVIANTKKVSANFNKIEVRQASSRVDWTGISIAALGTVSKGRFEAIDDADINLENCTFTDMDTFVFKPASTVNGSVFRRCGLVTTGGGTISNTTFDKPSGAVGVAATNLSQLADCAFVSDGTGHAVDLGTISGNITMTWDCTDSGYAATNGSTGNETIKAAPASGVTLTINVGAGKTTPTYYNAGAGTITVVSGQVTITLTGLKNPTEVRVFYQGTTNEVSGTGAENVTTGSHAFTLPASTAVDISILALGYQNLRILNYSTASDATLPVSQVIDRQYLNP